jgi:sugar phosphate permease
LTTSRRDLQLFDNDNILEVLNITQEEFDNQPPKATLSEIFVSIISNKLFLLLLFSITMMYFIVGGVLYWSPTYMVDIFKMDKESAIYQFSVVMFLAPVIGMTVGGIIVAQLGGYNHSRSRGFIQIVGVVLCAVIAPVPFINNKDLFLVFISLMILLGTMILPGMMLNSVSESMRGSTNSMAQISYNLLGFLPSPILYGFVSDIMGDDKLDIKSRIPMLTILYSAPLIPVLFVFAMEEMSKVSSPVEE